MRFTITAIIACVLWSLCIGCDPNPDSDEKGETVDLPSGTDEPQEGSYCAGLTPLLGNCRFEEKRFPADLSAERFSFDANACWEVLYPENCPSVPGLECLVNGSSSILIIASQEAVDALSQSCNEFFLPRTVDFAKEKVVVYSHHMGTCGSMASNYRLYRTQSGEVDVALFFWEPNDPFGEADTGCDSETQGTHGLILPTGESPHACLYEHAPCLDFGPKSESNPLGEKLCERCESQADCPEDLECRSAALADYCGPKAHASQSECPDEEPTRCSHCVDIGRTCEYYTEDPPGFLHSSILECTCDGWLVVGGLD